MISYVIHVIITKIINPIKTRIQWFIVSNMIFFTLSESNHMDCAICLEPISFNDDMYNSATMTGSCVHIKHKYFHAECINECIIKQQNINRNIILCKCPLCRSEYNISIIQ